MGSRKLGILALLLAILMIATFAKHSADGQKLKKESAQTRLVSINRDLASAFVDKVSIFQQGKNPVLVLTKTKDGNWVMESHHGAPARKPTIDSLLKNLMNIQGQPRSNAKELLGDFKLEEDQAIRVLLEGAGGKKLADTLVSALRGSGTQNFVRDAGSSEVLVTDTDLLSSLGVYSKDPVIDQKIFTDLRVATFDVEKITAFELNQPGQGPLKFNKKVDESSKAVTWDLDPPLKDRELDKDKVRSLLSGMSGLYAANLMDAEGKDFGFGKPWLSVQWGPEDSPEKIEIFLGAVANQEKKTQYIKAVPPDHVYDIYTSNIDYLLKRDKESFLKPQKQS